MGKKIVVLGGVGLIGTHLCLKLLNDGNEVSCVDVRNAADSPLLTEIYGHEHFRYINHNIINSFAIHCDEIYNLVTPTRLYYDRTLPIETLKVNVLGSINTLEVANSERARVLYASSGDIYDIPYCNPLSTNSSLISPKYILAEGKRAGEALHRAYRKEHDVDTRIARIFNTYGTGANLDDQRVVMKMIVAALRNRDIPIYGNGEQLRTFCWVGDIAEGLIRLMQAPSTEQVRTVDLGGNHELSIRALAEEIVSTTGSKSQIVHTEARLDDPRRSTPNLSSAKRELDWMPATSLHEGLKRTVEYAEKELARTARTEMSWIEMNV